MSPLALELVRRMSWFALGCALLLLAVPRVATELGLWGPTVEDEIAAAERALAVAEDYGARVDAAPFVAARADVERARGLLAADEPWRSRRAARSAARYAVEAQRHALTERETLRRRSAAIAVEIDRRLDDLETLHAELSVGADKPAASAMMSVMKDARRRGAGVLLAIEEGDYPRAVAGESPALAALEAAPKQLRDARSRLLAERAVTAP